MMRSGRNSDKLSSSFKILNSSNSEGKEAPRVFVHDENVVSVSEGDGDASLVADSASSDEARVSDDANEVKNQDQSSQNAGLVPSGFPFNKDLRKKADVSNADYESMLSMFDEYAANGKTLKVGHGYEVGDMVWGKVKSHPWWPGHIFSEAFATKSVQKAKREGHVLVAFFGDSSYGWFDPAELIPFELNYTEKSRQTSSRTFVKAVEDAVDELNRRHSLGLTCRCRNPYTLRSTNTEGYLAVDFGDSEGVFSVSQIKRARDSFVPAGMLGFMKDLALEPTNNEPWDIEFIQNNAIVLAFRKTMFEEFDETYSQAFGAQPARLSQAKASLKPSKAPLSGRLVFAEALGKRTVNPSKYKDEPENDKYNFKRRDEQSFTSSHPSQTNGSDLPTKAPNLDMPRAAEVAQASEDQPMADQFHANDLVKDNLSEKRNSGTAEKKLSGVTMKVKTDCELKKAKVRKRPLCNTESVSSMETGKTKKRKKDLAMETKSVPTSISGSDGEDGHVSQNGDEVPTKYTVFPDSLNNKDLQVNLPKLLHDLRALALNPFHGAESNCSAKVSQVFMNFRSLVYLKSPSNDSKEARLSMLASLPSSSDNNSIAKKPKVTCPSLKTPTDKPAVAGLLEDSTKGGLKRGPSDHIEVVAAKKKRINDAKLLDAKKSASSERVNKVDGKDSNNNNINKNNNNNGEAVTVIVAAQTVEKKGSQKKTPDITRMDGKEVGARKPVVSTSAKGTLGSEPVMKKELQVVSPTLLLMKFPTQASLPSNAELRAKFARFGSMDYNATRIFYKSHTCRVVYNRKSDAQSALNFATSNFSNLNVRCYIRENPEFDDSHHIGTPQQPRDMPSQLKSCLKRTSNEDGINTPGPGGGNCNGKGRVKFMLGGDDDGVGGEGNSNADDDIASSHGLISNTRDKLQVLVPPPSSSIPSPQIAFTPNSLHHTSEDRQPLNNLAVACAPPSIDIRQTMLSLLCRCEGILRTLEGSFGYVPYHL